MNLTYNEKKLLAVLKPLADAEEKKVKAISALSLSEQDISSIRNKCPNPLAEILASLEDTNNIALDPVRSAFRLLENASDDEYAKYSQMKSPDAAYLAEIMNTTEEAIVSHTKLLEARGLCRLIENRTVAYKYTEEGEEYARIGLPERILIDAFGDSITMKELQLNPYSKLGIGWLRKKGWVTIKDGIITKAPETPKGDDEKALENLAGLKPDSPGVQVLLKRKLIEQVESVEYKVEITAEGINLVNSGLDLREEIGTLTPDQIRSGEWENLNLRKYNIETPPKRVFVGKIHPYQQLINEMRSILISMGFTEIYGNVVQSSFWNFDALYQPQDHPAREMQDTFFLDLQRELPDCYQKIKDMHEHGGDTSSTGWGGVWNEDKAKQCVLRTHTTGLSIQYLKDHPSEPAKVFCIGRVYRRETIDPTHTPEFEQLEGIVMDSEVSFRHLMGFLKQFYQRMGFENVRFRPAYFPYTEPSVEPEVYVDGLGWVELGGAGIFREEVTAPWGVKYPVLAWGLGVSRVAMLRMGLKDLRQLYKSDVEWIRNRPFNAKEE